MSLSSNMDTVVPLFTLDVFTKVPFTGNPAAVCLLSGSQQDISDEVKQKIAAEMNLSETAFLTCLEKGNDFGSANRFLLRWFTPVMEIPLCGHGTIAAAAVLFSLNASTEVLTFETVYFGSLIARKQGEKIHVDFPMSTPNKLTDLAPFAELIKVSTAGLPYKELALCPATDYLIIRLDDSVTREQLEAACPAVQAMVKASPDHVAIKIVILTLRASSGKNEEGQQQQRQVYHFFSRVFAPWVGVNEDPVTGSAHVVLGAYWSKELGKKELFARQCSKRGGEVWMKTNEEDGRIEIAGNASIVIRGTINTA